MVWENVPGAFSVNGGRDFAAVLEETIRVAEPEAPDIPVPRKGWTTAGCFMGDGWSVAWRVLDAQYWGVPQRRRRIALVADFGGQSAPEILFKPKSVSGHFEPCGETGQGDSRNAEDSTGNASRAYGICSYESNSMKSDNPNSGIYEADTSRTLDNNGGNPACNQGGIAVVYENHRQDCRYDDVGDKAPTCCARYGTWGGNMPIVVKSIGNGQTDNMAYSDVANTLDTMHDQQAVMIAKSYGEYSKEDVSGTLKACVDITTSDIVISKEDYNATKTRNKILCLLQESYGKKTVVEWGVAVLAALQSAEVLQQEMHDSCDEREAKNWDELDDGSLPCAESVAEWLLRDMREQSECGCSSQGRESAEQRIEQSAKAVPELSPESTQTAKNLFRMWKASKGLRILRQTLSEIQEIWKSACCQERECRYIVRRLTPLEVERLQGYPDNYTDIGEWIDSKGKKRITSDSARYKALGNSIAIPPWLWVCDQIGQFLGEDKTMASLFDGIGGFPLIWSYLYGKENTVWASEIEEFPIAVTKVRFPDEEP